MDLIRPESISFIDKEIIETLGISEEMLIRRAGAAVARAIVARYRGGEVVILCGGGNNGADGYAAALALRECGIPAVAVDALGKGQRSVGGKAVLAQYTVLCGMPKTVAELADFTHAAVVVEAVVGSGARGALSADALSLVAWMNDHPGMRVAVDVPMGVDADLGEVAGDALRADLTVMLSAPKRGLYSYPARDYCGELLLDTLGLPVECVLPPYVAGTATDADFVRDHLPKREKNSHKGRFGRVHIIAGSRRYRGAAHLCTAGACRMGAGFVTLSSDESVLQMAGRRLPELLLHSLSPIACMTGEERLLLMQATDAATAVVVGPGCGVSESLYLLVCDLLRREGAPLLLDADALGAIAAYAPDVDALFSAAARRVVLTPHPMELARLLHTDAATVQAGRIRLAMETARRWGVTLLLKGAATVVTDGDALFLNTTGGTALAKGGSGDVLAGAVGALLAQGVDPTHAAAMGAYLHGAGGDALACELSDFGVTPSDLPRAMAKAVRESQKKKK